MFTIAVANHKGGVGKTATTVSLAACLAKAGKRILVVDTDAQAHATLWLLGQDRAEGLQRDISDAVLGLVPLSDVVLSTRIDNLDLAPSTLRAAELDLRLTSDPGRRDQRLRVALQLVEDRYDLVVIDCPPALSLVTVNALAAANALLSPVELTNFALNGLSKFVGWVEAFRREGMVTAPMLGVLPTFYDQRQRADREALIVLHNSGLRIFEPIPRRTGVEQLVAAQRVVTEGGAECGDLARVYTAVADAVLEAAEEAHQKVAVR